MNTVYHMCGVRSIRRQNEREKRVHVHLTIISKHGLEQDTKTLEHNSYNIVSKHTVDAKPNRTVVIQSLFELRCGKMFC